MTKKQKHRQNSFSADFNAGEDDFIVVDLDVMQDKEELSPVPLNHFLDDEETIARLLVDTGFGANDEQEEDSRQSDDVVIDDIDLADDFSGFDPFVIESVEQAEQNRLTEAEEIPVSDIHSRADFDEIPDEDAIDRLLVDSGFDANDDPEEDNRELADLVIDDIDLADDFSGFDQIVIEPVEQAEQNRLSEAEEIPVSDIRFGADYDEILDENAIDKLLVDANDELKEDAGALNAPVIDDISRANEFGVNFKEQNAMAADKGIFDSKESDLALDKGPINAFLGKEENHETLKQEQVFSEPIYQEALESLNNDAGITPFSSVRLEQEAIKKQINGYENKVKKAAIITYASLSFGIVALVSTVVMGVIVSSVQTKVSKLTELVSILEEDMSGIAEKNSDMEINNSDSPIEQLNQNVNGLPEYFAELDTPQTRTSVLEKKKRLEATFEKVSAEKKVELQKHVMEQSQSSLEPSKNNTTAVAKKQVTVNKSIGKQKTKTPGLENKKPLETADKITSAQKKTNNAKSASDWSVNLTAYKQLSDAKRKAANFIQKGIPVKVIAVDINNAKWYRLKIGGFKNKENADSYAAKIKKSLNLNTVFVGNI